MPNQKTELDTDTCPVCGHKENPTWAKVIGTIVIGVGLVIVALAAVWLIRLLLGAI